MDNFSKQRFDVEKYIVGTESYNMYQDILKGEDEDS